MCARLRLRSSLRGGARLLLLLRARLLLYGWEVRPELLGALCVLDVLYIIPEEDELSDDLKKFISAGGGEATIATPQRLVELARGLQVHESSAVREVRNLSSGEAQISFTSEHTDGNGEPLRIPGLFLIGIPVFRNGPIYRIAARLRYRKTPAGVVFWYDLWRTDRVFDHAFSEACERAQVETELPLFFGKPE